VLGSLGNTTPLVRADDVESERDPRHRLSVLPSVRPSERRENQIYISRYMEIKIRKFVRRREKISERVEGGGRGHE